MGVFGQQEPFTILFGCFRREQQGGGNPQLLLLFLTKQGKVTHREDVIQQELGGNTALGCPGSWKSKQRAMKMPD